MLEARGDDYGIRCLRHDERIAFRDEMYVEVSQQISRVAVDLGIPIIRLHEMPDTNVWNEQGNKREKGHRLLLFI